MSNATAARFVAISVADPDGTSYNEPGVDIYWYNPETSDYDMLDWYPSGDDPDAVLAANGWERIEPWDGGQFRSAEVRHLPAPGGA